MKNEIASKSKNELSGSTVFSKSKIQKVSGVSIYYDNIKCSPKDLRNNSDNIKKILVELYECMISKGNTV